MKIVDCVQVSSPITSVAHEILSPGVPLFDEMQRKAPERYLPEVHWSATYWDPPKSFLKVAAEILPPTLFVTYAGVPILFNVFKPFWK